MKVTQFATLIPSLILATLLLVPPALAETDYVCLNRCIQSGKGSQVCLKDCTYQNPLSTTATGHKLLATPLLTPSGASTKKVAKPVQKQMAPSIDYQCQTQCQQNGLSYDLCREKCVKK